jgi:hypothetical protein
MYEVEEIFGSHNFVMGGWVVFGDIVCKILVAWVPMIDLKLFLLNSVFEPVETHVKGFGAFLTDKRCENSISCGVICL